MKKNISQAGLFVLGGLAIWMLSRPEEWSRYGYLLGLLSEPFWFYTAYKNRQWGIMCLAVWYLYSWGQGVYFYVL